jgi:hypothetical protein
VVGCWLVGEECLLLLVLLGATARAVSHHDVLHYLFGGAEAATCSTRYRYDKCVGCIDITFYSNTNIMNVKARYRRHQLNAINTETLQSLNLNSIRNTLQVHNSVNYNNNWYTVTSVIIVDGEEKLNLISTRRDRLTKQHIVHDDVARNDVTTPTIDG